MSGFPAPIHSTSAAIDRIHAEKSQDPRSHIGASILGHHCERWIWLSFRWAVQERFEGRILRLFRRGQNEEATIIADLKAIGVVFRVAPDGQHRVDFGCHVSGSLDGIIESGVPEAPKKMHIAEFKTHSVKSFNDLVKHGVEKSKPSHWMQMQVYMLGAGIDRALYIGVCKDNDYLHVERVKFYRLAAEKAIERGKRIAQEDRIPAPISTDPSWYQCKFCPAYDFCHKTPITSHVNCRTCIHSTAKVDSSWTCERHQAENIPLEFQKSGCDDHVLHPDLVPWKMTRRDDGESVDWMVDGALIQNGTGGMKSADVLALHNPIFRAIMQNFPGAEVV